jgi:hypothetical protein
MPINGVEVSRWPGLFRHEKFAEIIVMHLGGELCLHFACHFASPGWQWCIFNVPVSVGGSCQDWTYCMCSDNVWLQIWFHPVEDKCYPSAPSYDGVLDCQNQVPVSFCILEDTVRFLVVGLCCLLMLLQDIGLTVWLGFYGRTVLYVGLMGCCWEADPAKIVMCVYGDHSQLIFR